MTVRDRAAPTATMPVAADDIGPDHWRDIDGTDADRFDAVRTERVLMHVADPLVVVRGAVLRGALRGLISGAR